MSSILLVGGYGAFGRLAAERLARDPRLTIIIAGRDAEKASGAADGLRRLPTTRATIASAAVDATCVTPAALATLGACVIFNASGPFQQQDYGLAKAAISAGCHYVDLADATQFVCGIAGLDEEARRAGVTVLSGASSVPALSSAVLDHYAGRMAAMDEVNYAISPGNRYDPGLATTASILSYVGKPFPMRIGGRWTTVYGWQGLRRWRVDAVGARWLGYCDVPDVQLFPARYPALHTLRFYAGTEVALFHLALWTLSWPVRWGLIPTLAPLSSMLLKAKRRLDWLGSDRGAMVVRVAGRDAADRKIEFTWSLVAGSGHGPYIPTTPAVILTRKLALGDEMQPGARPCVGELTLDDILGEVADLDIIAREQQS